MEIKQFIWNVVDSNSFLIVEGNNGLLIDVIDNFELTEALSTLENLTVILTHSHFDHTIGLNRIRKIKTGIKVISTKRCSENIGNKYRNMSSSATAFITFYNGSKIEIEPFICTPADVEFEEKYSFVWHGHGMELIAVHGHSNDSLIAIFDDRYLFSGDTLLNTPTVTRLPGGSTKRFWTEDIPMLKGLEDIQFVYPGHGETGRLTDMLTINELSMK